MLTEFETEMIMLLPYVYWLKMWQANIEFMEDLTT